MMKVLILACGLLNPLAFFLAGQPEMPEGQGATIRLNVNLIQLNAAVTDRSGQFVSGLQKQDFQLFVDGQAQPITLFERYDAPVAAGILVDNSASMARKGSEVIGAALAFARASNPQDQLFVVHFSDQARLGLPSDQPFTGDISELETALSRFSAEGTTALYDAVVLAISQCQKSRLERKILLIVSDGGDNSSREHFPEAVALAQKAGIVIYCIGIYDEADMDRNPRVLTQFAEITGGKAFFPSELKEVTDTCVKIARDIRQQYTLGFAGTEDGEYHRIEITVHHPGLGELKVHTRSGYFASKP